MGTKIKIFNLHNKEQINIKYICVDRRSIWGNPYVMLDESDRNKVCDQFEQYAIKRFITEPHWLDELRGKHLACWCFPKRCHAETLRRLANK